MRDISTMLQEEVKEFLNAIDIGEFTFKKCKYIKSEKVFKVITVTTWYCTDDDGNEESEKVEDEWLFYQDHYESEYPEHNKRDLYIEFLFAKGFKENRFKIE